VYESFLALQELPVYHLLLEGVLICWVIWLLVAAKSQTARMKLSRAEEEQLLAEWTPEPLLPETPDPAHPALRPRTVRGKVGHHVDVGSGPLLNLAGLDFLRLGESEEVEKAALDTLDKYGVGSCGPRGFYGTTEEHLLLERAIADFYGVEAAVLYSYGFSTAASIIPAYSKRGDVVFADEAVCFAIERGLQASRSKVAYFRHNDTDHLEELLEKQAAEDVKNPAAAKASRRFLVVEGLYFNTGEVAPLPKLVELARKYKLRLFLDESCSYGTLGETGRGVLEHWGVQRHEVDITMASLEMAGGSTGGFACGTKFVINAQRLAGLGYVFSASLPPLQCAAVRQGMSILTRDGAAFASQLHHNCRLMHKLLKEQLPASVMVKGAELSCIKHLQLAPQDPAKSPEEQLQLLERIVKETEGRGVCVTVASIHRPSRRPPPPSIRLALATALTEEQLATAARALGEACRAVL